MLAAGAAVLVALALPGGATAAPVAEEYVLDLPGVESSSAGDLRDRSSGTARATFGVVGDGEQVESRAAALGSTLTSPAGLVLLAPIAAGVALLIARRRYGFG